MNQQKIKVYVAGSYTKGDVAVNVKNALDAANLLVEAGFYPFVPHLTHFWHMAHPRPYEFWLELDNLFLPACDALLRLPGESSGADKEVELAIKLKIPVFRVVPDTDLTRPDATVANVVAVMKYTLPDYNGDNR